MVWNNLSMTLKLKKTKEEEKNVFTPREKIDDRIKLKFNLMHGTKILQ